LGCAGDLCFNPIRKRGLIVDLTEKIFCVIPHRLKTLYGHITLSVRVQRTNPVKIHFYGDGLYFGKDFDRLSATAITRFPTSSLMKELLDNRGSQGHEVISG
jgi:hypothetical protein